MGIITIATDYGSIDGYTASVKGVIKALAPESEIIDVTDDLPSILKASLVLFRYYSLYPAGTVHLMIIDPTVGTRRRALAGTDGKYHYVGPDNGIFARVIEKEVNCRWYAIDASLLPTQTISSTFHGRDIFAPSAALLATGSLPEELGQRITDPRIIGIPKAHMKGNIIRGEIIDIDRFGNLITNVSDDILVGEPTVLLKKEEIIPFRKTFADVTPKSSVAYIGSLGYLEIAVNMGRADRLYRVDIGSIVEIRL
jgi:S-adenosylmethionine hydrolase